MSLSVALARSVNNGKGAEEKEKEKDNEKEKEKKGQKRETSGDDDTRSKKAKVANDGAEKNGKPSVVDDNLTFEIQDPCEMVATFMEKELEFQILGKQTKKVPGKTVISQFRDGKLQPGSPGKGWLPWSFSQPATDLVLLRQGDSPTDTITVPSLTRVELFFAALCKMKYMYCIMAAP